MTLRLLEATSLVYLTAPTLIFILGWIRPRFAVPAALVVLFGLYRALRDGGDSPAPAGGGAEPRPSGSDALRIAAILGLTIFIVALSGNGGYAFQHFDWRRHNAFLRDLIEMPWPLAYAQTGVKNEPGVLTFYIGNSLAPALFGKLFGWTAANHFTFLWTVLAVFLALCWFSRLVGRVSVRWSLFFLFFGGLDIVGSILTAKTWYWDGVRPFTFWVLDYARGTGAIRSMGSVFWIYPSNLEMIYLAPQHVLGCWLALFLTMHDAVQRRSCRRSFYVWSCCFLYSAFTFLGMLPFVLLAVLASRARGLFSFENTVAALVVLGLTALYISSNNQAYRHGFLWEFQNVLKTWPTLLLFYGLEIGVYLLAPSCPQAKVGGVWRWVAFACLLAVPWYVLGQQSDFTTKTCLPSLAVMQVCFAAAMIHPSPEARAAGAPVVVLLVLLGCLGPVVYVARALHFPLHAPLPAAAIQHVDQIGPKHIAVQLFSDGRGFFWDVLARDRCHRGDTCSTE